MTEEKESGIAKDHHRANKRGVLLSINAEETACCDE